MLISSPPSPEDVFACADVQKFLFAERLNWSDLAGIDLADGEKCRITVLRNHTFEPIAALVRIFARFGGWEPDFSLSDYDDSLSFVEDDKTNLILLWLDVTNYKMEEHKLADWLTLRLGDIRGITSAPIVAAIWTDGRGESADLLKKAVGAVPGAQFADVRKAIKESLGRCDESPRMRAVGGTPLDREQQAIISRELGCRWLPALLLSPIKAVALDLDGTLHDGVLGEDGTRGVSLSPVRKRFQDSLKMLKDRGIFLSLVSRNEEKDVVDLFRSRSDYPLQWEDFSAVQAGWGEKADGISRLARTLRIGVDSVLFVDDNPGELAGVSSALPGVKILWADDTLDRALSYYPGLWRWNSAREDSLRARDLSKEGERERIRKRARSEDDYFRTLNMHLTYRINPASQLKRLAELSNKTNQFNLSLGRMGEAGVSRILKGADSDAVSVELADRLSESGVIGFVAALLKGETLFVEEVCVSCRALGRRIENVIVLRAITRMPNYSKCKSVAFNFSKGPRNAPALEWLEKLTGVAVSGESGVVTFEKSLIDKHKFSKAITFYDT